MFYQRKLRKDNGETTVGWIDERGARIGATAELKTADGQFWNVYEVYQPPMTEEAVREKQTYNRNALP